MVNDKPKEIQIEALGDLGDAFEDMGKILCRLLETLGPFSVRFPVPNSCTIKLTIEKE
jgi:hypothetical protein